MIRRLRRRQLYDTSPLGGMLRSNFPDAVGNRLSSLGMSLYAYNSSNELTSTPAATFTYDANGNMLTKLNSSGTTTYNWDFENRLSSVVLPGTNGTVNFAYDPFGRRIQKSSSSATTNYLYDGSNSTEEIDATGTLLARYTQGGGTDEPVAVSRNGTIGYYDQDGLRSVTSLAGLNAAILDSYSYDSFGNIATSTGSSPNSFQYTGRETDSEIGLHYYRARYYDSQISRFLNEDPVNFEGGMNFYAYVQNRPINFRDPLGLAAVGGAGTATGWTAAEEAEFQAFVQALERGGALARLAPLLEFAPALAVEKVDPLNSPFGQWLIDKFKPVPECKTRWRCRVRCALIDINTGSAVGYIEADGFGLTEGAAFQAGQNFLQNSTGRGFRTKHCHSVGCQKN